VSENNEYKSDPIDGDNDGIVQEGTPFERPVDEDLSAEEISEILENLETEDVAVEEVAPVVDDIISSPEPQPAVSEEAETSLASSDNGVVSSSIRKPRKAKKSEEFVLSQEPVEKVALFSTRNVHWVSVGKVTKGYNIVSRSQADQWLTRTDHIRLVEPNEVSKELGK
jgi:hypothetical protein